jgi:hypothetical protein
MAKFDNFPPLLCELATIKVAYFTFRAAKAIRPVSLPMTVWEVIDPPSGIGIQSGF